MLCNVSYFIYFVTFWCSFAEHIDCVSLESSNCNLHIICILVMLTTKVKDGEYYCNKEGFRGLGRNKMDEIDDLAELCDVADQSKRKRSIKTELTKRN